MNRTPFVVALVTIVAAAAVLRFVEYAPAVPLHSPLHEFPLRVAEWQGQTSFFTPEIVSALHVDDYVLRDYRDRSGRPLGLYIAYWGAQPPETRLHSPAVCLPAAGWYIAHAGLERIRINDRMITVNNNLIQMGDARQVVLYWYQMHGAVAAKELQAMSLLAWTSLTQHRTDEALVRINAPVIGSPQETVEREVVFVRTAFPWLERFLPE